MLNWILFHNSIGQDLQNHLDFLVWVTSRLPAIGSRSGEAGGVENAPT